MAKIVLVIDPSVKLTLKDVRELSETYVVLRCTPSQVSTPTLTDSIHVRTIRTALDMMSSKEMTVQPMAWRAFLAEKLIAEVRGTLNA
jgi:hypothetical protein